MGIDNNDEYSVPEPDYIPTDITPAIKPVHPWIKEFYPVPASEVFEPNEMNCALHTYQKWCGILPSNLEKHNVVEFFWNSYIDKDTREHVITCSASSCALCVYHRISRTGDIECSDCILKEVVGLPCAQSVDGVFFPIETPWYAYVKTRSPDKMILALGVCIKTLQDREHPCPCCFRPCYCKKEDGICTHRNCVHLKSCDKHG